MLNPTGTTPYNIRQAFNESQNQYKRWDSYGLIESDCVPFVISIFGKLHAYKDNYLKKKLVSKIIFQK